MIYRIEHRLVTSRGRSPSKLATKKRNWQTNKKRKTEKEKEKRRIL